MVWVHRNPSFASRLKPLTTTKSKINKLEKRLDKLDKQVTRQLENKTLAIKDTSKKMYQCTMLLLERKIREKHEISMNLAIEYLKFNQSQKADELVEQTS